MIVPGGARPEACGTPVLSPGRADDGRKRVRTGWRSVGALKMTALAGTGAGYAISQSPSLRRFDGPRPENPWAAVGVSQGPGGRRAPAHRAKILVGTFEGLMSTRAREPARTLRGSEVIVTPVGGGGDRARRPVRLAAGLIGLLPARSGADSGRCRRRRRSRHGRRRTPHPRHVRQIDF